MPVLSCSENCAGEISASGARILFETHSKQRGGVKKFRKSIANDCAGVTREKISYPPRFQHLLRTNNRFNDVEKKDFIFYVSEPSANFDRDAN